MNRQNRGQRPRQMPAGNVVLRACIMLVAGFLLGIAVKWLDLNSEFLGNLFSRIMIWFVLCTAIAVHSRTPTCAAVNVFAFCAGMLAAYYLAAVWWQAVWGRTFMYGWIAFSLCSPLLAYFTWYANRKDGFALLLKVGILVISLSVETILFGFRMYNLLLVLLLACVLFCRQRTVQK